MKKIFTTFLFGIMAFSASTIEINSDTKISDITLDIVKIRDWQLRGHGFVAKESFQGNIKGVVAGVTVEEGDLCSLYVLSTKTPTLIQLSRAMTDQEYKKALNEETVASFSIKADKKLELIKVQHFNKAFGGERPILISLGGGNRHTEISISCKAQKDLTLGDVANDLDAVELY